MAITTINAFKAWAKETTTTNDTELTAALAAAEAWIPRYCQRVFAVASTASARTFKPDPCTDVLRIPDCTTVTIVTENGTTLTAGTDYQTEPIGGYTWGAAAQPIEQLARLDRYWYTNGRRATVSVTATWGWTAIPSEAVLACWVLASDMYKNRDLRFGIVGQTDFAGIRARANPQVLDLLKDLRRLEAYAGFA